MENRKGESMKRITTGIFAGLCCLCVFCCSVEAKTIYVTGVTKITLRTGPGVDNKIVSMLTSGTKLEMIHHEKDWSEVATEKGKTGWVLTRFLTEDLPLSQVVDKLEKKNAVLTRQLEILRRENAAMKQDSMELVQVKKKYEKLASESENILKLHADYDALVKVSNEQKETIASLEKSVNNDTKFWFLAGAGVFLVGVLLGLSNRSGKRNSLRV